MKKIFYLILQLSVIYSFSQCSEYTEPSFKGGYKEFIKHIQYNVAFPTKRNDVYTVKINIDSIGKPKVKEIIGDEEVLKSEIENAIKIMPLWIPAKLKNINIDTTFTFKLYFSVNNPQSFFEPNTVEIIEYKVPLNGNKFYYSGQKEFNRAIDEFEDQNYQEAIELFNVAEEKKLPNIDVLLGRAKTYLKINDTKSACIDIKRGYFFNSKKFESLYNTYCSNNAINYNGINLLEESKIDSALSIFNENIQSCPNDTTALYFRSVVYLKKQKYTLAYLDLIKAIENNSVNSKTLLKANFNNQILAKVFHELIKQYSEQKDFVASIYYIDKLLEIYPNFTQAYIMKSDFYLKLNMNDKACININKLIEIDENTDKTIREKYCN